MHVDHRFVFWIPDGVPSAPAGRASVQHRPGTKACCQPHEDCLAQVETRTWALVEYTNRQPYRRPRHTTYRTTRCGQDGSPPVLIGIGVQAPNMPGGVRCPQEWAALNAGFVRAGGARAGYTRQRKAEVPPDSVTQFDEPVRRRWDQGINRCSCRKEPAIVGRADGRITAASRSEVLKSIPTTEADRCSRRCDRPRVLVSARRLHGPIPLSEQRRTCHTAVPKPPTAPGFRRYAWIDIHHPSPSERQCCSSAGKLASKAGLTASTSLVASWVSVAREPAAFPRHEARSAVLDRGVGRDSAPFRSGKTFQWCTGELTPAAQSAGGPACPAAVNAKGSRWHWVGSTKLRGSWVSLGLLLRGPAAIKLGTRRTRPRRASLRRQATCAPW